jgi:hypothetical protein
VPAACSSTSSRQGFFEVARRFKESSDPAESERLREDLARMIFGDGQAATGERLP